MYLKYAKSRENIKSPVRANPSDAIDIFCPKDMPATSIGPGQNLVIPSGLKFEVSFGTALVAVNKSGIAVKKSLVVGACLIDHGYIGEVHIDIHNIGTDVQVINGGDKIIQLLHVPVLTPSLLQINEQELYNDVLVVSNRGTGKMGSTGK